jgi:hypothetical protein
MTLSERIEAAVSRLNGDNKDYFRKCLNPVAIVARMCDVAKSDANRKNREPWGIIKEMTSHGSGVSSAIYGVYWNAEPEPELFPVFDILDRLYREGWTVEMRIDRFFIFDESAKLRASGATFRDLCTNIVLMGL